MDSQYQQEEKAALQVLEQFINRYGPPAGEEGPLRMVIEVLGVDPDPWQQDVLRAFGRGERRISIKACHGPGKTAVAAWCIINQLLCRFPQKTVATAPSAGQLKGALVPEIKMWVKELPAILQNILDVGATTIRVVGAEESSFFEARTARAENPEALQGVHAEHVLLVADEASAVPEPIYEAAAGSMSGHNATTLLLSNPTRSSGFFFDTHNKLKDMWFTITVSADDSPRVTDDFKYDIERRYGKDSNAYRIRVEGRFPKSDQDTIIPFELIDSAQKRDIIEPANVARVWALDVARFGDDANVLVKRSKLAVAPDIQSWQGMDLMQTAGRVKAEWDDTHPQERPDEILVDVIGMGAGVVDRLRELKLPARGINVSETSTIDEKYRNLRTELWFKAREWLDSKDHKLPSCEGGCPNDCIHERLTMELSVLKYGYTSSGKLMAEPKSDLKKRGYKSPDVADAFVLSFASEPASLVHGSKGSGTWGSNWNDDLSRGLAHV